MKLATGLVFVALVLGAAAAIPNQTVYLIGDESMAKGGGGSGCQGWGEYLQDFLNATVVNKAIAGSSAQSYWSDNHFNDVASLVKKNDLVIIEFGHHDNKAGIENFARYLNSGVLMMINNGAQVIISSPTPLNKWKRNSLGTYNVDTEPIQVFVEGSERAVRMSSYSTVFADHSGQMVKVMDVLRETRGQEGINSLFCNDELHLNDEGAQFANNCFVQALVCSELNPGYYEFNNDLVHIPECIDLGD